MKPSGTMAVLVAVGLAATSLAVANHVGLLPPISVGGELAYLRNYPEDGLETVAAGGQVTATYVAFTPNPQNDNKDRLEEFTSRGRMADAVVLHKLDLPEGTLGNGQFVAAGEFERAILSTRGDAACLNLANSVNAGLSLVARQPMEARMLVTGKFDLNQVDANRVGIERDGHTYAVRLLGAGSMTVDGGNIRFALETGDEVRGNIDREFPATSKVTDSEFDHLKASCEANPTPPPPPPPPTVSDASLSKAGTWNEADDVVSWELAVESVGDAPALMVNVTDDLPDLQSAYLLGGADSEACTLEGNALRCAFGDIPAGEGRSVVVQGYTANVCGSLTNSATLTSPADANPANDMGTATVLVAPCEEPKPDAGVTKTGERANDGTTVVFHLGVASLGDAAAKDVVLSDDLPDLKSPYFLGGPDSEECVLDGNRLVCEFGELAPGESRAVDVTGYTLAACGPLSNTAHVAALADANADNDQATAVVVLEPCPVPDVGVTKTGTANAASDVVDFGLKVESLGNVDATNVVLTDALPDLQSPYFLGGADSEDCTLEGNDLSCAFGDMAPGESRSVLVTGYTQHVCDELVNTANVAADADGNPANDASTVTVALEPCPPEEADVSVSKEGSLADDVVTWHLVLSNAGPGVAVGDGVYLNDTLPDLASPYTIGGADGGACFLDGLQLTCHWEEVPAGESRVVDASASAENACGDVSNTATAWAENDVTPDNNAASASLTLQPCADVGVAKSAAQDEQAVVFTLVVEAFGPAASQNVILTDDLPDVNRTWLLGGPDGNLCVLDGRMLTCDFGTLEPGMTRNVQVKAYTDGLTCGPDLVNTAYVSSDNDFTAANDAASATIDAPDCPQ